VAAGAVGGAARGRAAAARPGRRAPLASLVCLQGMLMYGKGQQLSRGLGDDQAPGDYQAALDACLPRLYLAAPLRPACARWLL